MLGAGNKPVKVLQLMTAAIHDMGLDPVIESRANDRITELEAALGGSERLLLTPIPTSYTRHTSRFLSFWTSCLPFALWPYFGAEELSLPAWLSHLQCWESKTLASRSKNPLISCRCGV